MSMIYGSWFTLYENGDKHARPIHLESPGGSSIECATFTYLNSKLILNFDQFSEKARKWKTTLRSPAVSCMNFCQTEFKTCTDFAPDFDAHKIFTTTRSRWSFLSYCNCMQPSRVCIPHATPPPRRRQKYQQRTAFWSKNAREERRGERSSPIYIRQIIAGSRVKI